MEAEEYLSKNYPFGCADYELKEALIDFAKIHVELALKKASEEASLTSDSDMWSNVDKNSIINAYPLENIK